MLTSGLDSSVDCYTFASMSIWVSRNGQQFGPYTLDGLRQMLSQGQFSPTDWAWIDGGADWIPLGVAISDQPTEYASPSQYHAAKTPYQGVVHPTISGLIPPDIHWIWLLVLGLPTLGIFPFIWFLRITAFVRELDPDETPMYAGIAGFICIHFGNLFGITHSYSSLSHSDRGLGSILMLAGLVCYTVARFRIRKILFTHYNSVEPIGLRLSDVMTFFFGTMYFQYHLSRIAQWKKTGYLQLQ